MPSEKTKLSRYKKPAIIIAVLVFIYAIGGFLVAPLIIKSQAPKIIGEQLGRKASVNQVRLNPFALSLTLRDFELEEPDGERFIGFEELYVNFQLSSLFRWAFTFSKIHLTGPEAQVKVLPDGSLNFSDLLAKLTQSTPTEVQSSGLSPVLVFLLQIEKGRFTFKDLSLPTPYEETFFPIQLTLNNFSTHKEDSDSPYSFTASMGESAAISWEGDVSVNPVRSQGRLAINKVNMPGLWQYFQDYVNFEVTSGTVDLSGRYAMAVNGASFDVELTEGEVQLSELILTVKDNDAMLLSVPSLSVNGTEASLEKKQVVVAAVTSQGAKANAWLDPDGRFMYETAFALDGLEERFGKYLESTAEPKDEPEVATQPWIIKIQQVNLENYAARIEDRTLETVKTIELDSIKVDLRNLSTQTDSLAELEAVFKVNQEGNAQVKGMVGINPVSADLTLKVAESPLKPMQPYMDAVAPVDLVSGTANLEGRVWLNALGSDGPMLRYEGQFNTENFKSVDRRNSEVIHFHKEFSVKGMTLDIDPNRLNVSEVFASQPEFRLAISPDGDINVVSLLSVAEEQAKEAEGGKKEVESLLDKLVNYITYFIQGPMPINIDTVRVEKGVLDFDDLFINPKFAADAKNLRGTVKGLSSKPAARADVLFEGEVNQYSPVKVSGQINPLTEEKYADLAISFKNFDLTTTSPYSGKFAGYKIDKGKLFLSLKYSVSGNEFSGENGILVEQLTLGERVESPDATKLPVSLGVALLKDSDGNIELDVPVEGDLDDPRFDLDKVIADAMGDIIANVLKSPFAALGNLAGGGGEELSYIEFEFGSAKLNPIETEKLDKLSKALSQRPALQLKVEGTADENQDGKALAEAELMRELKLAKRQELRDKRKPVPADADKIELSAYDYRRYMKKIYVKRFGEQPEKLLSAESESSSEKSQPPDPDAVAAAAKQRLVASMAADITGLQILAQKRATQIKDYLVQQGNISEERVVAVWVQLDDVAEAAKVRTNLTLAGS